MATKIRLQRGGKKNKPVYRIVVADSRQKRDGRFIEKLGTFNPNVAEENQILLNFDAALDWYMKGAEVSDTAKTILSREGVLLRKHLLVGVRKGALTQEVADAKFQTWLEEKRKAGSEKDAAKVKAAADKVKAEAEARIRIKKELEDAAKQAEAAAILAAEEAARPVVEAVEEVAPEASAEASEETAE